MSDWTLKIESGSPYLLRLGREGCRTIYLADAIRRTGAEDILQALTEWSQSGARREIPKPSRFDNVPVCALAELLSAGTAESQADGYVVTGATEDDAHYDDRQRANLVERAEHG
jgi:hypothetical protein